MTAQDLKNAILQLAVQGKLVPQDPNDEPASALLKQISAEKERLVKEGKIKKEKNLPEITDEDAPFDIPASWRWLRLGDFCAVYNGDSINATVKQEKYSKMCDGWDFIATKDVGFNHVINYQNGIRIPFQEADFKVAPAGSVLLCMEGGSAGKKIGILDRDVCFGNKLCCFTPITVHNTYLYYYLQCPQFFSDFMGSMTGLIGGVGAAKLKNIAISIPPLTEQKRIVAKIEELMPLVEEYGNTEERLTALNAEFPDKLRKSILQQAIQGKLTERDPADEPASELLKRIRAEKERLIKEGKIKKEKPLPPITEEDIPFEIPEGWTWVRLSDIAWFQGGYAYKSNTYVKESGNQLIRLGNVKNDNILFDVSPVFLPDTIAEETMDYRIKVDDILFTMTGTKGKRDFFYTVVVKEKHLISKKLFLNQRVGCLRRLSSVNVDWLSIFLKSETILDQIFATSTGNANQGNIGSENTMKLVIPLPSLAEQQRIVDRVNELLAVCDELK